MVGFSDFLIGIFCYFDLRMETFSQKIKRVTAEKVDLKVYNPQWPEMFQKEKNYLLTHLPRDLIARIEHFGSTAVPGLAAKPIIDILVEVASLEETKKSIVPILEGEGYDYFWRPTFGDDVPPFYAWFIKRDQEGQRTHHIHMVEKDFTIHWERLLFRDYLISHPEVAGEYQALKIRLAEEFSNDRVKYTQMKSEFINRITSLAKELKR